MEGGRWENREENFTQELIKVYVGWKGPGLASGRASQAPSLS